MKSPTVRIARAAGEGGWILIHGSASFHPSPCHLSWPSPISFVVSKRPAGSRSEIGHLTLDLYLRRGGGLSLVADVVWSRACLGGSTLMVTRGEGAGSLLAGAGAPHVVLYRRAWALSLPLLELPTDHLALGSLLTVVSIEIVMLWGALCGTEISIDRALRSLGSYSLSSRLPGDVAVSWT